MHKLGFTHCQSEHAIFYKYRDEYTLIMAVDVDNLTMARSSKQMILCFKDSLCKTLHIKDMGELHWLLGIEVKRDCARCTKSLSQCLYINKIVEWFSLQDAKPISTPLNHHHQHWDAVKRVFKYFNGTQGHVLTIGGGDNNQNRLQGFCNANWASQEHWNSTSSYIFTIDSGMVSW